MLIRKLQVEHTKEIEAEEEKFNDYQEKMNETENILKTQLNDITKEYN
jgi:hypothetical protein